MLFLRYDIPMGPMQLLYLINTYLLLERKNLFFPKLLSSFQISMEDKNRNVFVELRCIYHMHNEQRKSSMPIPKFCSKLSHTIPNAYTKIKICLRKTSDVFRYKLLYTNILKALHSAEQLYIYNKGTLPSMCFSPKIST